jgi:hypothetical protein
MTGQRRVAVVFVRKAWSSAHLSCSRTHARTAWAEFGARTRPFSIGTSPSGGIRRESPFMISNAPPTDEIHRRKIHRAIGKNLFGFC